MRCVLLWQGKGGVLARWESCAANWLLGLILMQARCLTAGGQAGPSQSSSPCKLGQALLQNHYSLFAFTWIGPYVASEPFSSWPGRLCVCVQEFVQEPAGWWEPAPAACPCPCHVWLLACGIYGSAGQRPSVSWPARPCRNTCSALLRAGALPDEWSNVEAFPQLNLMNMSQNNISGEDAAVGLLPSLLLLACLSTLVCTLLPVHLHSMRGPTC